MSTRERFILELAMNLNNAVRNSDRYKRLLDIFIQALNCDAACLFRKQGDHLIPLSIHGLVPEVFYRQFALGSHQRLMIIAESHGPVIFPHDSTLKDPFDGLLATDTSATLDVHSCLGCPLIVEGEVMGVLTADALRPHAFDHLDKDMLMMIAALAGATLRTSLLIEQLEQKVEDQKHLTQSVLSSVSGARDISLIGKSPAMAQVLAMIDTVGHTDISVLITGETGTGKELVARQIHEKSRRRTKALIYVNCAALPEAIAESELFGHRRGAFTGATHDRVGKFELADEGTIFLDEIGELPLSIQPKLLRILQEGEIQRVGSDQMKRVNVRVLAATNRNLKEECDAGRFRSDLFHRLNAYPIHLPPLRERRDDVTMLASHFCDVLQRKLGTPPVRFDESAKDALRRGYWPGNVRELKNVLSRAILNAHHQAGPAKVLLLKSGDFEPIIGSESNEIAEKLKIQPETQSRTLKEATQAFQRDYIVSRLERNGRNWSRTAQTLGLHRSNLHHLAKKLGLLD